MSAYVLVFLGETVLDLCYPFTLWWTTNVEQRRTTTDEADNIRRKRFVRLWKDTFPDLLPPRDDVRDTSESDIVSDCNAMSVRCRRGMLVSVCLSVRLFWKADYRLSHSVQISFIFSPPFCLISIRNIRFFAITPHPLVCILLSGSCVVYKSGFRKQI